MPLITHTFTYLGVNIMKNLFKIALAAFGMFSAQANYQLLASSGELNLNLPDQTFWISTSLRLENSGKVCFSLSGADNGISKYGILCGDNSDNVKLFAGNGDEAISEFYLFNDAASGQDHVVFAPNNGYEHTGIYTINLETGKRLEHENFEGMFTGVSGVAMNSENTLIYRHSFGTSKAKVVIKTLDEQKDVFTSFTNDMGYIFSPVTAGNYVLTKVRMGKSTAESQPDRLYLYNIKKGSRQIVMQDRDGQPSSKIKAIQNQYTVNKKGDIAVWAQTNEGVKLFASTNGIIKPILSLGEMISKFDGFAPAMNSNGDIVIRGYDKAGVAAIFKYVNGQWSKLIGEGDALSINGVDYEVVDATTSPFVHAPRINDNGTIAFIVYVINPKTKKLSTMVLKK